MPEQKPPSSGSTDAAGPGRQLERPHRGSSLPELAAAANREHEACEQAYGSAIEHAFRVGEYLLAAKAEVEHGAWLPWLEENFVGSERTARGYMRIARESNRQALADLGIEEALRELATPRETEPPEGGPEVDAEVVEEPAEPGPSIFDKLRDAGDLSGAVEELREKEAQRSAVRFPRTGVERRTFQQIHDEMMETERWLALTKREASPTGRVRRRSTQPPRTCARPASLRTSSPAWFAPEFLKAPPDSRRRWQIMTPAWSRSMASSPTDLYPEADVVVRRGARPVWSGRAESSSEGAGRVNLAVTLALARRRPTLAVLKTGTTGPREPPGPRESYCRPRWPRPTSARAFGPRRR